MKKARGGLTLRASKSRGGLEVFPANRLGLDIVMRCGAMCRRRFL